MDSRIENLNFAADPRNCELAKAPVLYFYGCGTCGTPGEACDCPAAPNGVDPIEGQHFYGVDIEESLPMHWAVCDVCHGKGTHVNPAIDCCGITGDDFAEDPDFAESYKRGDYDQPCNRCGGRTTIQAVDLDALSETQRKLYEEQQREEANDRACYLAEVRAGA